MVGCYITMRMTLIRAQRNNEQLRMSIDNLTQILRFDVCASCRSIHAQRNKMDVRKSSCKTFFCTARQSSTHMAVAYVNNGKFFPFSLVLYHLFPYIFHNAELISYFI